MAKAREKHAREEDSGDDAGEAHDSGSYNGKRVRIEQAEGDGDEADHSQRASRNDKTGVTRIRSKQPAGSQSSEPDIGIVESVELIDFMCHERAKVNLCPKVNFITGQNGSGKSAILTGLIIALGGKANTTNRATTLKGFIREGQSKAIIRVQLRNRGDDAYFPELFGSSIIIERQLSTGTPPSQFRIKNGETGAVVSRKKEDLVAITDHMSIQIDNPINILSQDAAREFLASTSPDKMYMFFLKGTQLFQLSEDLEIVRQAITRTEASINRKKEVLPEMRAEKRRWEQHYEDMKQARDLSAKMQSLSEQMAWAIVEEAEDDVKQIDEEIKVQTRKIAKIDEKVEVENAGIAEIEKEVQELQGQAQNTLAQLEPLHAERTVPLRNLETVRSSLRSFKQTETEINAEARTTRERIGSLKKEIEAERARLEDKNREGRENLQRAISQLEDSIRSEEDQISSLLEQQRQYEGRSGELRDARDASERTVEKHRAQVKKTQDGLEDLMRQTSNHMNAFGRGVPEALSLISKAKWQNMTPVGPIGKYLKVRDSRWARIIETTLDKSLNAFLVESHADRTALDAIFRRCGCQSRIIICSSEMFDYSQGEPSTEFLTILRALDISNEIVKRQLINLNRIEQIILVDQRALGDKIMVSNNGGFPRNVVACLSADGYNVGSRTGGLSTQAINLVRQSSRLGEDIGQAIEREKQVLANENSALQQSQQSLSSIRRELEDLVRKHEQAVSSVRQCKTRINKASSDIQQARERMLSDEPAKISALETELESLISQMESIRAQFRDHLAQQKLKEEELEQLEGDVALIDAKIEKIRDRANSQRQEADEKGSKKQAHINNIEYWNAKRSKFQEATQKLGQQRETAQSKVEEVISDACKLSEERVAVEHPAAKLDRMISECRARLEEIERSSSMSLTEVAEKAQSHINAYRKAKDELRGITNVVSALKTAHQSRLQKWLLFRDSFTLRTKLQFTKHLYVRNYTGKLEFDHTQRTLVPKVQTDQDRASEQRAKSGRATQGSSQAGSTQQGGANFQRKDTKSLSGGEKSFTTICLLLSLWGAMNCPVRALDEFDVFMDAANRAIAMQMMVGSARSSRKTQFILITPLDMSVKPDSDVTIFRLQPPKRVSSS
ncbi:Structural maintenance of chromosomes protein 6 [Dipsacomyces acuminosporus]|nr:Structural maintenance of chromosomes protein 6 [Dipsacomyces acuminosporus]